MDLVSRVLNTGCTPEVACRDAPDLLEEVRERLQRVRSVDGRVAALFPAIDAAGNDEAERSRVLDELPHVPGHEVLSVLGFGGMGVVYKARHLQLNRIVAVKMVLGGEHTDRATLQRLLREAEAVAALRHPNVVQVHEVGDHDGLPYFTMEYAEGGSLRERLAQHLPTTREAAALISTLAEAMERAHASGIVHRDLKPANVLFTSDGVPKIVDFGLARRIQGDPALTLPGTCVGTPSYMSPEQAEGGSRTIGPAADVYALGAILYAALTGRPPFQSTATAATLLQVIQDEPVRPTRMNPRVPRDLETICLKCLSKDPLRRYSTAAELAGDLQRFLGGQPILARPVGLLGRASRWARRRPAHAALVVGSVVAALSLVGGGAWLGVKRSALVRAVELDLLDVDRAAAVADWTGARTALERAAARLADGGSVELRGRVEKGARELDLVRDLDAIRMGHERHDAYPVYETAFRDFGLDDVPARAREVALEIRSSRIRAALVAALDTWATCAMGDDARRDGLLEAVRSADPDPTSWRDRVRDPANWNDLAALTELTGTAPLPEESVLMLLTLADHVRVAGGDAVPFLTRIQQQFPGDFWSNHALGTALARSGSPGAAVRYLQAAVALQPESVLPRGNLGTALGASGQFDEAVFQLREAIRLGPTNALNHAMLAKCLAARGEYAEAANAHRAAMGLDPGRADSSGRCTLAGLLLEAGRPEEAATEYRAALELDPRSYAAHYGLGYALFVSGLLEEAREELRRAIEIDSRSFAHESLGHVLADLGHRDEAITCLREAVRLDPKRAGPRRTLILSLIERGTFGAARLEADALVRTRTVEDPERSAAQALLDHCNLLTELEVRLPAIRDGTRDPRSAAESLAFADLFRARQDYAEAARWYADAFDSEAGAYLAEDEGRRFTAARCAALAGTVDEPADEAGGQEACARWRAAALAWLRADLGTFDVALATAAPGSRRYVLLCLGDILAEPAFAGVRDGERIDRLPEHERAQWRSLWSDVNELSARVRSGP